MMTTFNLHKRILCVLLAILLFISAFSSLPINAWGSYLPTGRSAINYEEYLEITEMSTFEDHFIRYEQIRVLGEFVAFLVETSPHSNSLGDRILREYLEYIVEDKNAFKLELSIRAMSNTYLRDKLKSKRISMPFGMKDMRKLDTETAVVIQRGPLFYYYGPEGDLGSIQWFLGDVAFAFVANQSTFIRHNVTILECDPNLSLADYPTDGEETICSRLLSANYLVALSAYYELLKDIPLQKGETGWSRMKYIVFAFAEGFAVVAAVTAPCIWLWLRSKRKRNATVPPESPESPESPPSMA